jgi:hypothetical protein
MSRLSGQGWYVIVTLNGWQIPDAWLTKTVTVDASEDNSTLASFSIRAAVGIIDIEFYQGKSVTIDVVTPTKFKRIFSGVVDIPIINMAEEYLTINCTNKIEESMNNLLGSAKNSIGYFDLNIFSQPTDIAEEIKLRLETVPQSIHLDPYNIFRLTNWTPKDTPDFVITNSGIYKDENIAIEIVSRGRIINTVNLTVQYRYERNYNITRTFRWQSPIELSPAYLLRDGYSMPARTMIQSAAESAGWPINGLITFDPVLAAGWYTVGNTKVAYSPVQISGVSAGRVDANGNAVLDSNGNQIVDSSISSVTDYSLIFTLGASWLATKRWTQTVTETFTLTLSASQSVAQYGAIDQSENYSYTDTFDSSKWESSTYLLTSDMNTSYGQNYFINRDTQRAELNNIFNIVANKAQTTILKTHRQNFVKFKTPIFPELDLSHTIQLDTTKCDTVGKVYSYHHELNIETCEAFTEIQLAIFKSQGSSSTSSFVLPTIPADSLTLTAPVINLGNHYGYDPATTAGSDTWTGFIGNAFVGGARTDFTESFVVDTPRINAVLTDPRELASSQSYNIALPNNALTITFTGVL